MDLSIYETGNGGDAILVGNDLVFTDGFTNMPYLAWFGGNPAASTTGDEIANEQRFDWWGNALFFDEQPEIQFNSLLEDALNNQALNSEGRIILENIATRDLDFFGNFAEVEVAATIISDDRIQIDLKLIQPDNLEDKDFQFIWDSTNKEVIEQKIL